MGVEHWEEEAVQSHMRQEAADWFCRLLNPLPSSYITDHYTRFDICSLVEIDPRSLNLPRWPDRAWSVIAESWTGEKEAKANRKAAGILMGTWYDHTNAVDLLEFCVLQGSFDLPIEQLHQELLEFMNSQEPSPMSLMSRASRKRWSQQVDYRGRPMFPLTEDEVAALKDGHR